MAESPNSRLETFCDGVFAIAFWFPFVVSLVLTLSYLVWLALGATYREARA